MCIKKTNVMPLPVGTKLPSARASYKWTGEARASILNKIGLGSSVLEFKCGEDLVKLKLKGVHINKLDHEIRMDRARLMREAGDRFFMLVDLRTHGVNEASRKRGGHYLYKISRGGAFGWKVQRIYYSEEDTSDLGLGKLQFYNVYWKVMKHCYYGVAMEDSTGDDNST